MKRCRFCEHPSPSDHLSRFMASKCEVDYVCDRHLRFVPKNKIVKEQPSSTTTPQATEQALW